MAVARERQMTSGRTILSFPSSKAQPESTDGAPHGPYVTIKDGHMPPLFIWGRRVKGATARGGTDVQ